MGHEATSPRTLAADRMLTLYLFRHAKSDWSDRSLADHDRPLAPRGRRAAPAMARYMDEHGLRPAIVVCSSASRTRETWALMAERIGRRATVIYERELYGASRNRIIRILDRVEETGGPVMLVGHNPGLEVTADALAGSGDPAALERMGRKFPTAALAVLTSDLDDWRRVGPGAFHLERFVRPKDLPEAEERRL